jgi:hypothetical protein
VKRLKKGSGKYKGKLPFKCFNCGRIGHFANKFPHKGKDRTSYDEDNDSSIEDKLNDFTLMAKEDYDNNSIGSDVNEEEVVVDMEGELISALEEIHRLRIKKRKQRQLLIQFEKDSKEPGEDLVLLKVELEEAKKIEEILKQQLLEKKARCESLEQEVVKKRK